MLFYQVLSMKFVSSWVVSSHQAFHETPTFEPPMTKATCLHLAYPRESIETYRNHGLRTMFNLAVELNILGTGPSSVAQPLLWRVRSTANGSASLGPGPPSGDAGAPKLCARIALKAISA